MRTDRSVDDTHIHTDRICIEFTSTGSLRSPKLSDIRARAYLISLLQIHSTMASSTGYACPFLSPTLKLYVSHLRVIHSKDANFSVLCGVRGCREVFRTFSAFNSHVYRHRRSEVGVTNAATGAGPNTILEGNGSNDGNYDVVNYSEFTASPGAPSELVDDRGAHCSLSSASSVNTDVFNRLQKQTVMLQLREG